MSQMIGYNPAETYASTLEGNVPATLNTRTEDNAGRGFLFVRASGAIEAGDVVAVSEAGAAAPADATNLADYWKIGVANYAFASGDYGWVQILGAGLAGVSFDGAAADVDTLVKISGTAGVITGTVTDGDVYIQGLTITAAPGTTDEARVAYFMAVEPHVATAGA